MINLVSYYKSFWKKTFDFKGVVGRKQFGITLLLNAAVFTALNAVAIIFLERDNATTGISYLIGQMFSALGGIYLIAQIVPALSLMIRRLHDHNDPWWYILLVVNPIGIAVLIVFFCLKTVTVNNKWWKYDVDRGKISEASDLSVELTEQL